MIKENWNSRDKVANCMSGWINYKWARKEFKRLEKAFKRESYLNIGRNNLTTFRKIESIRNKQFLP